jgi:hypothetical protein
MPWRLVCKASGLFIPAKARGLDGNNVLALKDRGDDFCNRIRYYHSRHDPCANTECAVCKDPSVEKQERDFGNRTTDLVEDLGSEDVLEMGLAKENPR